MVATNTMMDGFLTDTECFFHNSGGRGMFIQSNSTELLGGYWRTVAQTNGSMNEHSASKLSSENGKPEAFGEMLLKTIQKHYVLQIWHIFGPDVIRFHFNVDRNVGFSSTVCELTHCA